MPERTLEKLQELIESNAPDQADTTSERVMRARKMVAEITVRLPADPEYVNFESRFLRAILEYGSALAFRPEEKARHRFAYDSMVEASIPYIASVKELGSGLPTEPKLNLNMQKNKPLERILVIDDDDFDSSLIETALKKLNADCEILIVNDSTEAIAKHNQFKPDLTLIDISMPNINGFEVLERVAELERSETSNIVMLTSSTDMRDEVASLELGATAFKVKPSSLRGYEELAEDLVSAYG
jgi:PleD family two-component response regulator